MSKTWQENAGLLALRAGLGGTLVAHGVQKLFGWLGGHGLAGTGAAFEQMGFQPGRPAALAAGLGEAGGGVLIALGLATPAAGAAAVGTMIPATAVHAPSGFFATGGGYEYPALLGVSAAATCGIRLVSSAPRSTSTRRRRCTIARETEAEAMIAAATIQGWLRR